jgi:thymidine phosphorylase
VRSGESVQQGDPLLQLHHNGDARTEQALELLANAFTIGPTPPSASPLILERRMPA